MAKMAVTFTITEFCLHTGVSEEDLREIVGLLRPTEGAVRLFGHPVLDPDPVIRRSVRRRFGMLFQQGALFCVAVGHVELHEAVA